MIIFAKENRMMVDDEKIIEKKRFYYAVFFPCIITLLMVLVFLFERGMGFHFENGGVEPRNINTFWHIFLMPFIHADVSHLLNNIIAFLVLCICLYYFYSSIANKVLFLLLLFSGIILWVIGRESLHIGASGIIYGLSFFLFFSGILRKYVPLIAISLILVFLYGNNVWHLFPWEVNDPVSWEGHLSGAFAGILLAVFYRKKGPQKPVKIWEEEDDDNVEYLQEEKENSEQNQ